MVETRNSEINIERLMAEIREAVARREANGQQSLAGASLELRKFLSSVSDPRDEPLELPPLELQPEFVCSPDDHYHVNDLLQYHDHTFVWNAYRAILKREPDEFGLNQFLNNLRSGRYDKLDILASLRFSPEGKDRNVSVEGLGPRPLHRRLYHLPVIGYLLEMIVGIARLPATIHRRRQFEEYALAQQELMASHINQLSKATFQATKPFPEELADLSHEQRRFAELQHQQVVGLFREQRKIIQSLEKLREEIKPHLEKLQTTNAAGQNGRPAVEREKLDALFAAFTDEFRGKREDIQEGLRHYLPLLKGAHLTDAIVDLGCGRGEWLELLKEEDLQALGVESNPIMVEQVRSRGLDVVEEDLLAYLKARPSESFNVVTGFHLVEHLPFESLIELIDETMRTLRPGGMVIYESPNPKNLTVAACNFYADPGHNKPIFPETIEFILRHKGFEDVQLQYLNPVEDSPFRNDNPGSQELDIWFFGARDFAVMARKSRRRSTPIEKVEWEPATRGTSEEKPAPKVYSEHAIQVTVENKLETVDLDYCVSETGHKFYARPNTDDRRIFQDVVDHEEYPLPPKFNKDDVLIDIGAHIGSFSYAALQRGAGKVYAYEAHPVNHAITRKNLEQFGERAECRNLAVWRSDIPSVTLFNDRLDDESDANTGGHAVVYNIEGVPIQTVGLDDILDEATNGFTRKIRMLKIDCEGAEYPILFSSKFLNTIEEICGEYHEIPSEIVPEGARVEGMPEKLDRHALKDFLESAGWSVELHPNSKDEQLGNFRALPKKKAAGSDKWWKRTTK